MQRKAEAGAGDLRPGLDRSFQRVESSFGQQELRQRPSSVTKASFVGLEQRESIKLTPDQLRLAGDLEALVQADPSLLGRYLTPDWFGAGNSHRRVLNLAAADALFLEPCASLLVPSAGAGPHERRERGLLPGCVSHGLPSTPFRSTPPPFSRTGRLSGHKSEQRRRMLAPPLRVFVDEIQEEAEEEVQELNNSKRGSARWRLLGTCVSVWWLQL